MVGVASFLKVRVVRRTSLVLIGVEIVAAGPAEAEAAHRPIAVAFRTVAGFAARAARAGRRRCGLAVIRGHAAVGPVALLRRIRTAGVAPARSVLGAFARAEVRTGLAGLAVGHLVLGTLAADVRGRSVARVAPAGRGRGLRMRGRQALPVALRRVRLALAAPGDGVLAALVILPHRYAAAAELAVAVKVALADISALLRVGAADLAPERPQ